VTNQICLTCERISPGDITQKVKQARGVVHSHDASTQIPELDEGSMTLGSRLGNVPKIVSDFAVRGLEFPAVWVRKKARHS
jgi:hypothetical protein